MNETSPVEATRIRPSPATAGIREVPAWLFDLWTERLVLGLVLVNPDRAAERFDEIKSVLVADDFFAPKHRLIFKGMEEMRCCGLPLDSVCLVHQLERAGDLEPAGGFAYVASLTDGVPRIADVRFTCLTLRRKALLRIAARRAEAICEAAMERDAEPEQIALQLRDLADHLLEKER
jgi:replicative DNA helicase